MKNYKRYEHGSYPFRGQDWDQRQSSREAALTSAGKYMQGNRFSYAAPSGRGDGIPYPEPHQRLTEGGRYYGNLSDYEKETRAAGADVIRDAAVSQAGKGPRSYKRSDDRIKEMVCERLYDDPYVDASGIEIDVQQGEVTLTGTVDEREAKGRAEYIAEGVAGLNNVVNRIRIRRNDNDPYQDNPYLRGQSGDLRSKIKETFR